MSYFAPAPTVPAMPADDTIYLPSIGGGGDATAAALPCGMDSRATAFVQLWRTDARDEHTELQCDSRLVQAAQERVRLMLAHDDVSHEVGGITANELARRYGYVLPGWYHDRGNNVESLAAGQRDGPALLDAVWQSPTAHKEHIFALVPFFKTHTHCGAAYAPGGPRNRYTHYWAIYTCPAELRL